MKLQCPIDKLIVTSVGYTFNFKKNVPLNVPPIAIQDCLQQGCYAADGEVIPTEEKKEALDVQGPERETALKKQIRSMVARNKRGDFTGSGKPDAVVMTQDLGFQVFAKERDILWLEVSQTIGEEAVE